jgi:hypothetical protein
VKKRKNERTKESSNRRREGKEHRNRKEEKEKGRKSRFTDNPQDEEYKIAFSFSLYIILFLHQEMIAEPYIFSMHKNK